MSNFHQERVQRLNAILVALRDKKIGFKTPGLADIVARGIKKFGYGTATVNDYTRTIVDALQWEDRHPGKEYRFQ